MALSRAKYKRLPDLYVAGKEVVLKDGTIIWVQVLNPFQIEEARHDAQSARSRLVMALNDHGSAEMAFVEAALWSDGLEAARERLVEQKSQDAILKVVNDLRNDRDWRERLDILDRSDDDGLEEIEKTLLQKIQKDYVDAINKGMEDERDFLKRQFAAYEREQLLEEYKRLYIDRRGGELATAEFRIVEIWYGARVCEGVRADDGQWDHSACESHEVQAFETKAEVRQLPGDLADLLGKAYDDLTMSIRDAKDLDRLASSSVSSRQPSAEAGSTPSTPAATPSESPGTSTSPSPTPSQS